MGAGGSKPPTGPNQNSEHMKQFMTFNEAVKFMDNSDIEFESTTASTFLGMEPAYVGYQDGKEVCTIVVRDILDHPSIFAFETWDNGDAIEVTPLYEGQEALDFISAYECSPSFADMHVFASREDAEVTMLLYLAHS